MRPRTAERPRVAVRLADAALIAVAVVGAVVLVCRVAGALLGLQLVSFATGSMSPVFPQGSVAVIQQVPLAAVRIGDVVEVDRPGALPITHRVVAVALRGDEAVVRLKGDANRHRDPAPYVVRRIARVVAPLPPAFAPLRYASTAPVDVLAVTAGALAVGWALWPRNRPANRAPAVA